MINADQLARHAASLLANDGPDALAHYDPFPAPIYAIDGHGRLQYFNEACVALAGRTPRIGIDRWCVCAATFTAQGEWIDGETGPMAIALREARPVRDIEAVVERPCGERIAVQPYATPAVDVDGQLVGAVNVFVPLDGSVYRNLLASAERCRKLAKWIGDRQASESLVRMAEECEQQALILAPRDCSTVRN